jgi:hypothetical protein
MAQQGDQPQLEDTSDLTDADWAEINKLKRAYADGGRDAFDKALDDLYSRDEIHWMRIVYAYHPAMVREALKDNLAGAGMTAEDLRELISKLKGNSVPTKH